MDRQSFSFNRDRPDFSSSYGIDPHQKEGLLDWEWVSERMTKAHNYWISSTRPDGRSHVAPVWGVFIDNVLFFGTNQTSIKAKNLFNNPFAIAHLESGDETVIFEGKAFPVKDLEILEKISILYGQKYPGYQPPPTFEPGTIIFSILPETVFAWQEANFLNTPTRWKFKS